MLIKEDQVLIIAFTWLGGFVGATSAFQCEISTQSFKLKKYKVSASLFNMIMTDGLSGRENSWHLLGGAEKGAG